MFVDHHGGVTANGLDPAAEFLGVAHRGRETDQSHMFREVQDHLLPHGSAHPVGEKVNLIHDHVGETRKRLGTRVQHVAQHLGGHHHHRRIPIDRLVAGKQADLFRPVTPDEVVVLLVTQRLDRRGVKTLLPGRQREVDCEFPHYGLAGTGRSAYQDTVAALQGLTGLNLERIEREAQLPGEVSELRTSLR